MQVIAISLGAAGRVTALGCPDVDGAYAHLRAHAINAKPPKVASYGVKQLYFRTLTSAMPAIGIRTES